MATLEKQNALALPILNSAPSESSATNRCEGRKSAVKRGLLALLGALVVIVFTRPTLLSEYSIALPGRLHGPSTGSHSVATSASLPPLGIPKKVQRHWGQYSPYFPAGDYVSPPDGCTIEQVNILQRHGARYPDTDDDYYKAVKRLQHAKHLEDDLKFLKDYEYTLGENDLLAFGALQSHDAGKVAYERYAHLLYDDLPFVRASGMQRVVDTAGNWSLGFMSSDAMFRKPHSDPDAPLPIQIISEKRNDTLNIHCPNSRDEHHYTDQWLHQFAPTVIKKLRKMAKGVDLEDEDVKRLLDLCIFETIADASKQITHPHDAKDKDPKSPFCDLFKYEEWKDWEYWGDVEKYYKTGYGNPLGPVQGVGYINELIARLTNSPVEDRTQHNYTLEFPLDRTIYADFTHENLMVAVYSAMGLFNVSKHLDPKKLPNDDEREWFASHMVPFSARMVVEKLSCPATAEHATRPEHFVRIFVNDELQPLEFCNHADTHIAGWQKKHGLCTVQAFVHSQGYARRNGDGDFSKCYN